MTQGPEQIRMLVPITMQPKIGYLGLITYLSVAPMCTILYAMMRTQKSKNLNCSLITFILGFPFSLIPHFGISD